MTSTRPALAISTRSGVRVSPTIAVRSGTAAKTRPTSVLGYSRARSAAEAVELTLRGVRRDARRQSAHDAEPVLAARLRGIAQEGSEVERKPQVCIAHGADETAWAKRPRPRRDFLRCEASGQSRYDRRRTPGATRHRSASPLGPRGPPRSTCARARHACRASRRTSRQRLRRTARAGRSHRRR